MVGERARDHLGPHRLAAQLEVLAGELDRRLDGVAARRGEEHPVEIAGRACREPFGEHDRRLVGERPDREVGEAARLLGGRLGELLAAVPDLHGEQAGQSVEVAAAVLVVDVAALAAVDDRHVPVGASDVSRVKCIHRWRCAAAARSCEASDMVWE